jgi:adenosylcobyric acid synthase
MGFAEAANCPVLLVGDIDRGGVFAQLVGTLALLSESEQARTKGFIINRFRGDIALLKPGLEWLEKRTHKPVMGTLPYLHGLVLDSEDSIGVTQAEKRSEVLNIIVPALPRISNHTDFDPLRLHPQVSLTFVGPDRPIPSTDVILLPGSKSTASDLAWLKHQGWEEAIARHLRYGGKVLGICGGFQMLGEWVDDPEGLEGKSGKIAGLGLLPLTTRMVKGKQLRNVSGVVAATGATVTGYEIHNGVSEGAALRSPLFTIDNRPEGAMSDDGQIIGTYLHGLFDHPDACQALLKVLGLTDGEQSDYQAHRERELDRLADMLEHHVDIEAVIALIEAGVSPSR